MRRFFVAPRPPLRTGDLRVLDPACSSHLSVLRVQPGDTVSLFDGSGHEFTAQITAVPAKDRVEVVCRAQLPLANDVCAPTIVLGVALGKHEKIDYMCARGWANCRGGVFCGMLECVSNALH